MVEEFPFKEYLEKDGSKIRIFDPSVDSQELQWHFDEKNRMVEILENDGWKFQFDNELPKDLKDSIYIPSGKYHRVIKGKGLLKIKIIEDLI